MSTVSTEWGVWIQGTDDVMPALGRRDAHERAHKVNTGIVWGEQHRAPSERDRYLPTVWAVPCEYGTGTPIGKACHYPADMTAGQVEQAWTEWES
jgi:hypothetical protein